MLAPSSSSSMETPDERRSMRNRRLSFHSKSPSRVFFVFFFHQRRLGFKAKTEPGSARLGSFFCFFLPYSLISSFRRLFDFNKTLTHTRTHLPILFLTTEMVAVGSPLICVSNRGSMQCRLILIPLLTSLGLMSTRSPGMLFLERPYQGPGLAQMVNISESYLALVAEVGDIPPAQSVELKDLDQTVHNVMESSPLKVKEDDEVDKLDIELDVTRKSRRVYRSVSPEVSLKISRSLKSLNAKTGMFSKRMKILHRDPKLFAQRVAAIKRAKRRPAARKRASEAMKTFFSDPENRRKRSLYMKGAKFYCSNCGEEGHRRNYCPATYVKGQFKFKCGLCGERGHNRRACPKVPPDQRHDISCGLCAQSGHNRRTCPQRTDANGHNRRTRPQRTDANGESPRLINVVPTSKGMPIYCSKCGEQGHSSHHCPALRGSPERTHRCQLCGIKGHNIRTCCYSESRVME